MNKIDISFNAIIKQDGNKEVISYQVKADQYTEDNLTIIQYFEADNTEVIVKYNDKQLQITRINELKQDLHFALDETSSGSYLQGGQNDDIIIEVSQLQLSDDYILVEYDLNLEDVWLGFFIIEIIIGSDN